MRLRKVGCLCCSVLRLSHSQAALQETQEKVDKHLERIDELEQTLFELQGEIGGGSGETGLESSERLGRPSHCACMGHQQVRTVLQCRLMLFLNVPINSKSRPIIS